MNSLFQRKHWTMHSGEESFFKIECDALTDEDIETIALVISKEIKFFDVYGIPTGGERLAQALMKYRQSGDYPFLIVDDVLTTGTSMQEAYDKFSPEHPVVGVVIFSRGECPWWVSSVFQLWG